MSNHENLSTPFIYLRSTGEKISVTKEQHDSFYKEADRIRHKEQDHHQVHVSHIASLGDAMATAYRTANITQLETSPSLDHSYSQTVKRHSRATMHS